MATTTSDSDHPSPRQRATARLGLFAAAAALAAVSSIAASRPAHAAQSDRQCWAGDSGRACDGVGGAQTGTQASAQEAPTQQLLGPSAPLGGLLGGLGASNMLGGLGIPIGGGGLPLGLGGLGGSGGSPGEPGSGPLGGLGALGTGGPLDGVARFGG